MNYWIKNLIPITVFSLVSCTEVSFNNNANNNIKLTISAWGNDVNSTKPVLETGLYKGEKYDYVISSYPLISIAKNTNSKIEVKDNVTSNFANKNNLHGFPQAGLFINKKLETDEYKNKISSFLSDIDLQISKLVINDGSIITDIERCFSKNLETQSESLGLNTSIIASSYDKFAFINNSHNPDYNELFKIGKILDYSIEKDYLSSYYLNEIKTGSYKRTEYDDVSFSLPMGAPSLVGLNMYSKYINNNKIEFETSTNIRSKLIEGNTDFIIFDATTGMNIGKDNYKLVRMVTYGNLYLVSTGNDENNILDENDKVFAYGEELIIGKVIKATYEK